MHAPSLRSRTTTERGSMLVPVMMLVLMMAGLSMGLLVEAKGDVTAIKHKESSMKALEMAEMGLVQAELEIYGLRDTAGDGLGTVTGTVGNGTYEVTAAPHPTLENRWTLTATGTVEHSVRRVEVGVRRRARSGFAESLYARDVLDFGGSSKTDAYDSRLGTYASQATNADGGGSYAEGGGHLGSGKNIILMGSSTHVRGNAIPGPLFDTRINGSGTVWGDTLPRQTEIDLPPTPPSAFTDALLNNNNAALLPAGNGNGNGNGGNGNGGLGGQGGLGKVTYNPVTHELRATAGGQVVLDGGTYFFSDVTLTGDSQLVVKGPTKIYVTGSLDLSGGTIVNQTGIPAQFQMFVHPYPLPLGHVPSKTHVELTGGAHAAGVLYAPETPVSIHGGSDWFGAIVGGEIDVLGGVNFHYDKALGDLDANKASTLERLYWRELLLPRR